MAGKMDDAEEEQDEEELPLEFELSPNYPNPFNPVTTIRYALPEAVDVNLVVYDILGRRVRILFDATQAAGYHSVTFDASDLPSGLYLYRLQAGEFSDVRKMILLK